MAPRFSESGVSRFDDRDMGAPRIRCEVGKRLSEQRDIGHNRWHPEVPPLIEIEPGGEVILEAPGYDDYQLQDNDNTNDVSTMDLTRVHPLAGPVAVRGAEPGDLLVVDLLELSPLSGVGYSCIIPEIGGILRDIYPEAYKSVWYMRGNVYAESRHIPGVRIPALPHPGVIGVAPSHEMLIQWNDREAATWTLRISPAAQEYTFRFLCQELCSRWATCILPKATGKPPGMPSRWMA